jgi:hypothetical protein
MSNEKKIPKCLLKIFHGSLKKSFEEDEEIHFEEEQEVEEEQEQEPDEEKEEEELHFRNLKIKKQEQQQENNEENIKQQKKVGLMCHCSSTTVLREVKKDGPNKGKLFYTCSKSYDEKCDYFMWKDESDKKRGQYIKPNEEPIKKLTEELIEEPEEKELKQDHDEKYYKQQQKMGLMCYCKLPSVSREVKKDGSNKGKIFYTCSRYFDDKCKYFVWKDEIKK